MLSIRTPCWRCAVSPFAAAMLIVLAGCGGRSADVAPGPVTGGVASPQTIDALWVRATDLLVRRKWDDAAVAFERLLLETRTGDPRLPRARYNLAEARLGQKSNLQAVREFRRVADDFATDSLAPIALVRAGEAYAALWRRPELDPTYGTGARATLQEVLTRFPGTPAAARADAGIAALDDKFAYKALRNAAFYQRYKAYDSAILLLKDLIATWPRTRVAPDAIEHLIETYRILGYAEDVRDTCEYFRRQHPTSPRLDATCPVPAVAAPPTGATPGS